MFKLYREAFKIVNDGIILAVPLALFWWIVSLYVNFSVESIDTLPKIILTIVTIVFMFSTFSAGWFYMVKKAIKFSKKTFIMDKDKSSESLRLIRAIPRGIGHFFLYFVEASALFVALGLLLSFLIKITTSPFVTEINNVLSHFDISVSSSEEMGAILETFSSDLIMALAGQILLPSIKLLLTIGLVTVVFSFLLLLWMPEIIYTRKNASIALFTSIKKVLVKFWKSLKLYAYILLIQFILSCLGFIFLFNPITYMISMVIYFYFIVYVVVLIFSYYDSEFTKAKSK